MEDSAHAQSARGSLGQAQPAICQAKAAYTTRFVSRLLAADATGYHLVSDWYAPRPGDVVLARVETIGQHTRLELPGGRRATLFVGDVVLVAYGNRYAPDQFEAEVPGDLGPVHLVAAGGVAGRVISAHEAMDEATLLQPLGLLADNGGVVSLRRCAPLQAGESGPAPAAHGPTVFAVLGTSMNSGKTTTVAALVRGLAARGLQVAAGKVTGTGAGGDPYLFTDSGASAVLDFTDFGYPSTYLLTHQEVRLLFTSILDELAGSHADVVVVEVADGLLQRETARLIADPVFGERVHGTVFAAGGALAAQGGCAVLAAQGLAPLAVAGRLTASPLVTREAKQALDVPVYTLDDLANPTTADMLLARSRSLTADALAAN